MDNIWEETEQERIVEWDTKLYNSLNPESGQKNPGRKFEKQIWDQTICFRDSHKNEGILGGQL